MRVSCWTHAIAYISAKDTSEARARAKIAGHAWRMAHAHKSPDDDDEMEDFDIGQQHLMRRWAGSVKRPARNGPLPLPKWDYIASQPDASIPPCFTVRVESLPRDASVEWFSQGLDAIDGDMIQVHGSQVCLGSRSFTTQSVRKSAFSEAMLHMILNETLHDSTEEVTIWIAVHNERMRTIGKKLQETERIVVLPVYQAFDENGEELDLIVQHIA